MILRCFLKHHQLLSLAVLIPMGLGSILLEHLFGTSLPVLSNQNYWTYELQITPKGNGGCNNNNNNKNNNNNNWTTEEVTAGVNSSTHALNRESTAAAAPAAPNDEAFARNSSFSGLAIIGAFNHQRDVFKNSKDPVNATFQYIESWYESLLQYPSIEGIVLHNMFTPEQTKAWTTHQIHFVSVHNRTSGFKQALSSKRPINDLRFFVLNEFLKRLYATRRPDSTSDAPSSSSSFSSTESSTSRSLRTALPDYVLFSDSYDVRFLRNPFEYMQQIDHTIMGGEPQVFVGEEYAYKVRKNIWDGWMNKSSTQCFGKSLPPSSRMINCGLVGGRFDVVLELMERLIAKLKSGKPGKVCDQISLYYTLSKYYGDKYISGYPFNSQFNQWETANDTLAYIAHK